MLMKRRLNALRIVAPVAALSLAAMAAPPQATPVRPAYFSIATGATGGSDFPVGSMIATILSHPAGSVRCDVASACGPPGLIAVAVASQSALANVRDVADGRVDSAFMPADIASWAYHGTGPFKANAPLGELRAIARLYPEPIQIVIAHGRGITSLKSLGRRKVAADLAGSATQEEALRILATEHLSRRSLTLVEASPERAADLMRQKKLDAFFFIGAAPSEPITSLFHDGVADLLPLDGAETKALAETSPYLVPTVIPAGAYPNSASTSTLAIGALWIVRASASEDLIYQLTRALWDSSNSDIIERAAAPAQNMALSDALEGIDIPLHPGAARFYTEKGLLGTQRAATQDETHGMQIAKKHEGQDR